MHHIALLVVLALSSLATASFVREFGQPDDVPPADSSLDSSWAEYQLSFDKSYDSSADEAYRRNVWEDNLATINKHNREAAMGHHTYWMGVNQFTDMTEYEFSSLMLSGLLPVNATETTRHQDDDAWVTLPSSIDWRDKNLVTPVKDQGQCGSCWAFSATGAIEGQHAKKSGRLVSVSEQQLVDCSRKFGNHGCKGGLMEQAFKYVAANKGIDTEQCYPYTAKDTSSCKFKSSCIGATVTGYKKVPTGENNLQKAVADVGPIAVSVMATRNLQHYKTGLFIDNTCPRGQRNHGVLVVGYQSDYWIIKNSWGTRWGMQGYVHWARNRGNMCGVASDASYPTV